MDRLELEPIPADLALVTRQRGVQRVTGLHPGVDRIEDALRRQRVEAERGVADPLAFALGKVVLPQQVDQPA